MVIKPLLVWSASNNHGKVEVPSVAYLQLSLCDMILALMMFKSCTHSSRSKDVTQPTHPSKAEGSASLSALGHPTTILLSNECVERGTVSHS